jgi:hypothetical protein
MFRIRWSLPSVIPDESAESGKTDVLKCGGVRSALCLVPVNTTTCKIHTHTSTSRSEGSVSSSVQSEESK